MANDPGFIAHCLELLAPLGAPRARRMFGGHGLYVDDLFIAIVDDDRLYLKADDQARPAFERAGCEPFTYPGADGQRMVMAYWTAPEDAVDSPASMQPWARLAMASALRAQAAKAAAKARKPAAKAPRKAATPRRAAVKPKPTR
jgi:DNA transformation protein